MKVDIKVTNGKEELVINVPELTSEQIPTFLQNFHRSIDEFNKRLSEN